MFGLTIGFVVFSRQKPAQPIIKYVQVPAKGSEKSSDNKQSESKGRRRPPGGPEGTHVERQDQQGWRARRWARDRFHRQAQGEGRGTQRAQRALGPERRPEGRPLRRLEQRRRRTAAGFIGGAAHCQPLHRQREAQLLAARARHARKERAVLGARVGDDQGLVFGQRARRRAPAAIRMAITAWPAASRAGCGAGSSRARAAPRRSTFRSCSLRSSPSHKVARRRSRSPAGVVAAFHKPGSVAPPGLPCGAGDHSSGTPVAGRLVRPTLGLGRAALERPYTWPCSGWGLPCRSRCRLRGGLLPHRFTLARSGEAGPGGLFSVALSSRSPSPGVTRHPALRSPDFPPARVAASDHLDCCGSGEPSMLPWLRDRARRTARRLRPRRRPFRGRRRCRDR